MKTLWRDVMAVLILFGLVAGCSGGGSGLDTEGPTVPGVYASLRFEYPASWRSEMNQDPPGLLLMPGVGRGDQAAFVFLQPTPAFAGKAWEDIRKDLPRFIQAQGSGLTVREATSGTTAAGLETGTLPYTFREANRIRHGVLVLVRAKDGRHWLVSGACSEPDWPTYRTMLDRLLDSLALPSEANP